MRWRRAGLREGRPSVRHPSSEEKAWKEAWPAASRELEASHLWRTQDPQGLKTRCRCSRSQTELCSGDGRPQETEGDLLGRKQRIQH